MFIRKSKCVLALLVVSTAIIGSQRPTTSAQTPPPLTCAQVLPLAQKNLAANCAGLDRNEVCYAHPILSAQFSDPESVQFARAGDIAPLSAIKSITTGPLDLGRGEWGLAVLKIQANLPGTTAGQAVTFILYGNTTVSQSPSSPPDSLDSPAPTPSCTATTLRATVLSARPNQQALKSLPSGTQISVRGRSPDSASVLVEFEGIVGWVPARNLKVACDLGLTPSVVPGAPAEPTTMGAFYFSTGIGAQPECKNVPTGLMIRSPKGSKVLFNINGVDMTIGSTVVLHAQPGRQMTVSVVQGQAVVKAANQQRIASSGQQLSIPLGGSSELEPVGPPTNPRRIEDRSLTVANTCGLVKVVDRDERCDDTSSGRQGGSQDDNGDDKGGDGDDNKSDDDKGGDDSPDDNGGGHGGDDDGGGSDDDGGGGDDS